VEGEAEGDEDRDATPHGPRCMDSTDPATRNFCPTSTNFSTPTQPGKQRLKTKKGRKKREKGGGKEEGGASRSSHARVQRPKSDIETQIGELYCCPSPLSFLCACAGPKGPVVARFIPESTDLFNFKLELARI
jgi:hypothetical protein